MSLRARLPRRTVRLRLALVFGLLFFVTGVALLAISYVLMRYAITHLAPVGQEHDGQQIAGQSPGPLSGNAGPNPQQAMAGSASMATRVALDDQKLAVLRQLGITSTITLAVMSITAVVLGWIVADRVLRPLRTITSEARTISATSLHRRLALAGPDDELKELGDTFDALLSRLEVSFEAQRRFVANASHELRTPLSRQRALGQVALLDPDATMDSLRAAHQRILAAGAQQERLIDALLTLAHGQAGIDVREPFDLAQLTHEAIAARLAEAQRTSITVLSSIAPATVVGHRNLAERLVTNLIDNALRHNHPGGRIEVGTSTVDSRPVLTVSNTGPVVPPEAIGRLFQPFQRLQTNRTARSTGHGLGLSIVEAVARAHDGTVVATAPPEGGLVVTVTFLTRPSTVECKS